MRHGLKLATALLVLSSVSVAACRDDRPGRHRPPHGDRWDDRHRDHDRGDHRHPRDRHDRGDRRGPR